MGASWLDTHRIHTSTRSSWAQHLTQPGSQYGIGDALGEDTTRKVLSQPATAASTSTQPPSESVTPSISHGEDHARRILHELPVPDAQGFDITHEHLHTAYQWIGLTLTTPPDDVARHIRHTLDARPAAVSASDRHRHPVRDRAPPHRKPRGHATTPDRQTLLKSRAW